MREEFRASLGGLADDLSRTLGRLQEMQRDLRQVTATARDKDGLVTVVVGPRGQLQDVRLDSRVYRRLTPSELSQTIMKLVGEATADVSGQLQTIMNPFLPEGVPYEEILGEKGDLTSLLPQAPSVREEAPGAGKNTQEGPQ